MATQASTLAYRPELDGIRGLANEHDLTGRISLRRFYERRVRRLLPALVAVLFATGVLMALLGRLGDTWGQAAVSVFHPSDVAEAIGYDLGYVGHTWSIALEEQFYLLWPALVVLIPRRFLLPVVVAGIVGAVAHALASERWIERPFRGARQELVSGFAGDAPLQASSAPSPSGP